MQKNGVILRTELGGDLPAVLGDRVQLQQVTLNLMMNGIEAMSTIADRQRGLLITTHRDEVDTVCVTVKDSGIGFANFERIFEPFYTTKSHGMGMGLSISRSIIEAHNGRLWATPNNGLGTSFHFTLPIS
jgi:signal transduction histidine kinase